MFSKKYPPEIQAHIDTVLATFQSFGTPMKLVDVIEGHHTLTLHVQTKRPARMAEIEGFRKDLAYALGISEVEIEAPIPDKHLIGIHIPSQKPKVVEPQAVFESDEYTSAEGNLVLPYGVSEYNDPIVVNLDSMPHMLIGGSSGSGKSTFLHTLITSVMGRYAPDQVQLMLIDSKRVEFSLYDDSPFLVTPSITNPRSAIIALRWVAKEMDRRYDIFREHGLRDIREYQSVRENSTESMPYILIIIDELADIMSAYPQEVESAIVKLCTAARPVGIHLVVSTQRPSVQVITGPMKANILGRIAFKVPSMVDSRTILDESGAEKLQGAGDALYKVAEMARAQRMQTPRTTTDMVKAAVKKACEQYGQRTEGVLEQNVDTTRHTFMAEYGDEDQDSLYEEVREVVMQEKKASTSMIQRRFRIGYGRAARIMDQLEAGGVIKPSNGTNAPRPVLTGTK